MRVHHIALRTTDVARLERFYSGVLGVRVRERRGTGSVWLDADGVIVMLERADDGEPGIVADTKELVAFGVEVDELPEALARLAAAGVAVEARTEFTHYVRDPDGRRVALSHYPHAPRA